MAVMIDLALEAMREQHGDGSRRELAHPTAGYETD
jgi:hypothetical protein